ncbi:MULTISPECIES: cold-shock protein [Streptomyces]|uniref:cold-shock protein n=1 Tax=Streptomyces TaxID=1883 RepID=UPI0035D8A1D1
MATAVMVLALAGGGVAVGTTGAASASPGSASADHAVRTPLLHHYGVVKWWNAAKGFGFITYQLAGHAYDIYVNYTGVIPDQVSRMHAGAPVEFNDAHGPHGSYAFDVRVTAG